MEQRDLSNPSRTVADTRQELQNWSLALQLNYEKNPEWFEEKAAKLSEFLAEKNLWPPFRGIEILVNNLNEMVLHPGSEKMVFFSHDQQGKLKLKHWLTAAKYFLMAPTTEGKRNSAVEALHEVRQLFPIGKDLTVVSLAMNPGPDEFGKPAPDLMMSFVMKEKDAGGAPLMVGGSANELQGAIKNTTEHQPLRLSTQLMSKLNRDLDAVEELFGGTRVRLPEKMADDAEANVKSYQIFWESSAFYTVVVFTTKEGIKIPCLLNRAERVVEQNNAEHLQEGSGYFITTMIEGRLCLAAIEMNRLQGFAGKFKELPRGFAAKTIKQIRASCFIAMGETGLTEAALLENQTKDSVQLRQDSTFENAQMETFFIHLPDQTSRTLSNQQQEMPAKQVEALHPGWLVISELLDEIAAGKGLADAHSLGMLTHWLVSEQVITLKPEFQNEGLVFEATQDWRSGDTQLTILRSGKQQANVTELGFQSPNTGSTRIHDQVLQANDATETLGKVTEKTLTVLTLKEILQRMQANDFDIITLGAILKYLLQNKKVNIATEKLQTV